MSLVDVEKFIVEQLEQVNTSIDMLCKKHDEILKALEHLKEEIKKARHDKMKLERSLAVIRGEVTKTPENNIMYAEAESADKSADKYADKSADKSADSQW